MTEPTEDNEDDKLIRGLIEAFHRKMQASTALAITQLKHAQDNRSRDVAELEAKVAELGKRIEAGGNAYEIGHAVNQIIDAKKLLETVKSFPQEAILAEIIFMSIFSSLDAFLNNLLHAMFFRQPQLLNNNEPKTVDFNEVLGRSKDEIVNGLIDKEVESLLRKSYIESFDRLAKKFRVGTLKKFKNWPHFVERSQRRNLITHAGGTVSKQYLDMCKAEKIQLDAGVALGSRLEISKDYLLASITLVTEVGIKLGQVLWRSFGNGSILAADRHLAELLFQFLKREEWGLALAFGEFAEACAARKYDRPRNERALKIITINHAQAAKWSGDGQAALKIVNGTDWSGSAPEYALAAACLNEKWDEAAEIMRQIGPYSDSMPVYGYVGWPIFRQFRETDAFAVAFESIFGVQFAEQAKRASEPPPTTLPPETESDNAT